MHYPSGYDSFAYSNKILKVTIHFTPYTVPTGSRKLSFIHFVYFIFYFFCQHAMYSLSLNIMAVLV